MDSSVFKYKQQQLQQQQHFNNIGSNSKGNINNSYYNNNSKQNSIFILNTTTNSILPNHNSKLFYSDLNDNNVVSSSSSSSTSTSTSTSTCNTSSSYNTNTTTSTSSSMWLSASSTMCSPAAHAIQKLFNCSSTSLKSNQGNYKGIETKSYKTKSDLLKKKTKIWKYLEGEGEETAAAAAANMKSNQPGIENETKKKLKEFKKKSFKYKAKYWLKSACESDNQNNQDLAELLEYSCSLCDNCQCIDCQIAYFDCDNSDDDSNSEYSFHLSAYEEDDEEEANKNMELISADDKILSNFGDTDCRDMDNKNSPDQLQPNNSISNQSCQQCLLDRISNHQ